MFAKAKNIGTLISVMVNKYNDGTEIQPNHLLNLDSFVRYTRYKNHDNEDETLITGINNKPINTNNTDDNNS